MPKKNASGGGSRKQGKVSQRRQQQEDEDRRICDLQAAIARASQAADHLVALKAFKKYDRGGIDAAIDSRPALRFDEAVRSWAFDLTKANMEALYGAEWNDGRKRQELTVPEAFYLVATAAHDSSPLAFVHYRFELYYDSPVVYCYELQCQPSAQSKGLGKFLMQILELIAFTYGMSKVVLTCFKANDRAQAFYRNKLGYVVDSSDPEGEFECNYNILSKAVAARRAGGSAAAAASGPS